MAHWKKKNTPDSHEWCILVMNLSMVMNLITGFTKLNLKYVLLDYGNPLLFITVARALSQCSCSCSYSADKGCTQNPRIYVEHESLQSVLLKFIHWAAGYVYAEVVFNREISNTAVFIITGIDEIHVCIILKKTAD